MDVWSAERVLASAAVVGEGPVWDAEEKCLYWVDIECGEVHRFDPLAGRDTIVITLDRQVGAVGLRVTGGLVLAVREGFATWDPGHPDVTVLASPLGSNSLCRMNDGACDAAGRVLGRRAWRCRRTSSVRDLSSASNQTDRWSKSSVVSRSRTASPGRPTGGRCITSTRVRACSRRIPSVYAWSPGTRASADRL